MRLESFAARYVLERELSREYGKSLRAVEREFSAWLKRRAQCTDLTDARVNSWLAFLCAANGRARVTMANKRQLLLILWRAAWRDGLVSQPPRRVRVIAAPTPPVRAWTRGDVKRLLAIAARAPGRMMRSRVPRAKFWRAFILTAYYSGLRLGDLCRLRWEEISADGTILTVQHKTGEPIVCRVRRDCLAALKAIRSAKRLRPIGDCLCRKRIILGFRALVRAAGLSGGTRMLRRTGATQVEINAPGWGRQHLGHRSYGTAERHYLDASQIQRHKPTPPRIR